MGIDITEYAENFDKDAIDKADLEKIKESIELQKDSDISGCSIEKK